MVHVRKMVISGGRLCCHPLLSLNCVINQAQPLSGLFFRLPGIENPPGAGCLPAFAFHPTPAPMPH